jgi:GNAT superfamily N-acetyltransferase
MEDPLPRYPIPAILLARMAVSEDMQGRGVGRELVGEVATLTLEVARVVAVRALVVDAVDERAASFYEHVGLTRNEANPLRLEVLAKDLGLNAASQQT